MPRFQYPLNTIKSVVTLKMHIGGCFNLNKIIICRRYNHVHRIVDMRTSLNHVSTLTPLSAQVEITNHDVLNLNLNFWCSVVLLFHHLQFSSSHFLSDAPVENTSSVELLSRQRLHQFCVNRCTNQNSICSPIPKVQ